MKEIPEIKKHLFDIKNSQIADRNVLDKNISALSSIVERYYSKESPYQERVKYFTQAISMFKLHKREDNPLYGITSATIMAEMNNVIDNIIREFDNLGLAEKDFKIDKSIKINNTLNQTQVVEFNLFVEIIKDELTGRQIKEIKDIVEDESNQEVKKTKIIEKLKSFGGDILSNIIANIITNPNIYSNF